jgi:hypothetical protein
MSIQLVVNVLIGVVKIHLVAVIIAAHRVCIKSMLQLRSVLINLFLANCGSVKLGCVGTSQNIWGSNPVAVRILGEFHEGLTRGGWN